MFSFLTTLSTYTYFYFTSTVPSSAGWGSYKERDKAGAVTPLSKPKVLPNIKSA
jgi:hypothetical protein